MEGFVNRKYAVAVKREDWAKFVKLADDEGLKWASGADAKEYNPFDQEQFKNTVFVLYSCTVAKGMHCSFFAESARDSAKEHRIVGLNRLTPRVKAPYVSSVKYTLEGFLKGEFHAIVDIKSWATLAPLLDACGCKWASRHSCAEFYPYGESVTSIVCSAKEITWERPDESPQIAKAVWNYTRFEPRDESMPHVKYRVVIESDGIKTNAFMTKDGKSFKSSCACCSPSDRFDFEYGATLALLRLVGFKKFHDVQGMEAISSLLRRARSNSERMSWKMLERKGDDDE